MPGFIARQLCPSLIIVPTNFDKYRAASEQTRRVCFPTAQHALPTTNLRTTPYLLDICDV